MSLFTCTKCGATATSKCTSERSIFPTLPGDGKPPLHMFLNSVIASVQMGAFGPNSKMECWHIEWGCYNEHQTQLERIKDLQEWARRILDATPEEIAGEFCKHHWALPEGTTCELGHEHN